MAARAPSDGLLSTYLGSGAGGIDNAASLIFDNIATDIGFGVDNQFGMPLTEHPNLDINPEFLGGRKRLGLPMQRVGTGMERTKTIDRPAVSLSMAEVGPHLLNPFLWLLFQKASTEGITPFAKTFDVNSTASPYDPACEVYSSVCRCLGGSGEASEWQAIHGCIARSITLNADEAGSLGATIDLMAAEADIPFTLPTSGGGTFSERATAMLARLVVPAKDPLLWQNATVTVNGTAINIRGFSLTMTNNAILRFYDNAVGLKYILGEFGVTGSFMMPWDHASLGDDEQIKNFKAGTDVALRVYWGDGTTSSEGEFEILTNVRYTGAPLEAGEEMETNLSFEGAFDNVLGTGNTPCKIISVDAYQFGIA
jgi:hypothetical protein